MTDIAGEILEHWDEPNPRMIRLILTRREWRDLKIQAAERETSMQSLVAHWISQQLTKPRYLDG